MYGLKIGGLVRDPLLESQSNKSTLNPPLKTHIQGYPTHTHTYWWHLSRRTTKNGTEKVRMRMTPESQGKREYSPSIKTSDVTLQGLRHHFSLTHTFISCLSHATVKKRHWGRKKISTWILSGTKQHANSLDKSFLFYLLTLNGIQFLKR